ncbi:Uracil-DNA glycosylase-like domain-containing protein [Comamonas aquatilis]|uniref:uracil-DNA glycosylase family protein n=1 Tax=Comamonas aquatilis TaxID=1778406 RepID=UPI0039EF8BC7
MAMNLDARQRAMLEAMGITVWLPEQALEVTAVAAPAAAAFESPAAASAVAAVAPVAPRTEPAAPVHSPVPPMAEQAMPAPAAAPVARPAPAATRPGTPIQGSSTRAPQRYVQQPAAGPAGEPGLGWKLGQAQLVYPDAAQPAAQGGWLILLEPPANPLPLTPDQKPGPGSAQTALQGDAAKLLDNMLRALNLQQHPRVYSAALLRAAPDADLSQAEPVQPALQALLQQLRPDCVLVLGLAGARAVLGRHDALGRLRAEPHRIAGVPTVVTYDPNYLLRAPQAKAGAWADLCAAQALATK